jgi:L-seryl-tRNA(Ser) seleniumtransferase
MEIAATGDINIEYDLETGKRGDRDDHLEQVICELTGAEAATVVNNNAAAVMLVLNSLAKEREVIISRGELVEIGGAFRIPEVMKSANCILREVGTTNRTHAQDYREAVNEQTALMMRVHTSNYEIKGFTKSVSDEELGRISRETGVVFVSDLGSGTLVELTQYGLPKEPTVRETLDMGADLVTFSGDKLLGGPQAGIIVGRADLIYQLKRNQLKRALRIDKVTMAALLAVLDLYRDPEQLRSRLPLLRDLTRSAEEIEQVCRRILPELEKSLANRAEVGVDSCKSQIGSGSLPLDLLDSYCLSIKPVALKGERDASLLRLAQAFRQLPKPVVGRIHDGKLLLDFRCLRDEYDFIQQLNQLEL